MSDLMMQMITHDGQLQLRVGGGVDALSRSMTDDDVSEALFAKVVRRLNELGRREPRTTVASHAKHR